MVTAMPVQLFTKLLQSDQKADDRLFVSCQGNIETLPPTRKEKEEAGEEKGVRGRRAGRGEEAVQLTPQTRSNLRD